MAFFQSWNAGESGNPEKMNDALLQNSRNKSLEIFRALRSDTPLSDREFDEVFAKETRQLSSTHWTPVQVAVCAAEMLVTGRGTKVLDIGCGPGKFCLIGAAMQHVSFAGIDQRGHLLEEGQAIARRANISNVEFIHGNMMDLDWSDYNAFYLYNPFLENVCMPAIIDETVPLKPEYFYQYVEAVQQKLMDLPSGTRVVTYHGFGGEMPYGYRMTANKKIGSDFLQCWIKESDLVIKEGATRAIVWRG
jgi:SAM-dependent methyltransferase